jgi:hypothetical protein
MLLIPVASVVLFIILWRTDLLPQPYVVGGCVVVGVAVQLLAPSYSLPWLAGLLLNAVVAIYMAIRLKLS